MERERIEEQAMSWDGMENGIQAFIEGAEWAIQELEPKWIKCIDKQPEVEGNFLVCNNVVSFPPIIEDAFYQIFEGNGSWYVDGKDETVHISHWTNLLLTPKEDQI